MICHTPIIFFPLLGQLAPSPTPRTYKIKPNCSIAMTDWLYCPHITHPFQSNVAYYLPWHPGDLQLTRQRRMISSTSSFWCLNHPFLLPWDRQNSPRRKLPISKCGDVFSVPSSAGRLRGWGPTLLDSSRCHLIDMTDAKSGQSMTYLPIEWIIWLPRHRWRLPNQLLGVARKW